METIIIGTQIQTAERATTKRNIHVLLEECPALMYDKNERITAIDIFETKV